MRGKLSIAILLWMTLLLLAACASDHLARQPGSSASESSAPLSAAASSAPVTREESRGSEHSSQSESSGLPSTDAETLEEAVEIIQSAPESAARPEDDSTLPLQPAAPTDNPVEGEDIPPVLARSATSSPGNASLIERELLRLINDERTAHGLEPLGIEEAMQFAARIRAQEALESLSHTRPDGTPYHTAFDEAGFSYAGKWHGENIAMIHVEGVALDEYQVAAAIFDELIQSSGHHKNILGESFYQIGVGVYVGQEGSALQIGAAQLFAGL